MEVLTDLGIVGLIVVIIIASMYHKSIKKHARELGIESKIITLP